MPARKNLPTRDIVEALERCGGVVGFAAQRLGISPHTLKRRLLQDPGLQEDGVDAARDRALVAVHQALGAGDAVTAKWYLARYGRRRGYGPQKQIVQRIPDAEMEKILGGIRRELATSAQRKASD